MLQMMKLRRMNRGESKMNIELDKRPGFADSINFNSLSSIIDSLIIDGVQSGLNFFYVAKRYKMMDVIDFKDYLRRNKDLCIAISILDHTPINKIIDDWETSIDQIVRILKKYNIWITANDIDNLAYMIPFFSKIDAINDSISDRDIMERVTIIANRMNIAESIILEILKLILYYRETPETDINGRKPQNGKTFKLSELTISEMNNILGDIEDGIPYAKIMRRYSIAKTTFKAVCKRKNIILNMSEALHLYKIGYNCTNISRRFDTCREYIYDILDWSNVERHNTTISTELSEEVLRKYRSLVSQCKQSKEIRVLIDDICEEYNLDRCRLVRLIKDGKYNDNINKNN